MNEREKQTKKEKGKAFEQLIKSILIGAGFTPVPSEFPYAFDGPAGQMVHGLGQAHNADVLVEPIAQIPFYYPSRLIIECKNYNKKIGLNIIRSAFGMREDINSFEIVNEEILRKRERPGGQYGASTFQRYYYQVGVASFNSFTKEAQEFADAHRIPLIPFKDLPIPNKLLQYVLDDNGQYILDRQAVNNEDFNKLCEEVSQNTAIGMLDNGQIVFLYNINETGVDFNSDTYNLRTDKNKDRMKHWSLKCDDREYAFQLPKLLYDKWENTVKEKDKEKENKSIIRFKNDYLANMVVYYRHNDIPRIKMLSITADGV